MRVPSRSFFATLIVIAFAVGDAVAAQQYLDPAPPGSFGIVVIPDTQKYRGRGTKLEHESADDVTNVPLESHVRWIVANLEAQRIAFVTHVGDLVDRDVPEQWAVARRWLDCMHGRIPYGIAPGNHDMRADGDASQFVGHFGASRFQGVLWYGGAFEGAREAGGSRGGASNFQLFSAGGLDFVFLHLECNAPDDVLAWADRVLCGHAKRRAIVATHMDLGPIEKPQQEEDFFRGSRGRMLWKKVHGQRGNTPQQMWEKCFRNHDNLFLILCGDQSRSQAMHLVANSAGGKPIQSLLSDYSQDPKDWLRVLRFLPDRERVDVLTVNSRDGTLCLGTRLVPDPAQHCFSLDVRMSARVSEGRGSGNMNSIEN